MTAFENPALKTFVAQIADDLVMGQVLIRRRETVYELRHVQDCARNAKSLRHLQPGDARALAQSTAEGDFRPLKSAPTLQTGWQLVASDFRALETALNSLYPGAIADWYAAQAPHPPVTHYRTFTGRQSGMYRITTKLSDSQVAEVIRSCCHRRCCLKRRLWTVEGLAPDAASDKSMIPCLEPCAVLLESARKAGRLEQEESIRPGPGPAPPADTGD